MTDNERFKNWKDSEYLSYEKNMYDDDELDNMEVC